MIINRVSLVALFSGVAFLVPALAAQNPADYQPGERWNVTTSMTMEGMSLPSRTIEVCKPKDSQDAAPTPEDSNCKLVDHKVSGNKTTGRIVCTGKDEMEGTFEGIIDGPDHYRGKMIMKAAGGEMTMTYAGRRLPGECDAGEMERKGRQALAKVQGDMAKMCRENAEKKYGLGYAMFVGRDALCKDPKDKRTFCANVQGYEAVDFLTRHQNDPSTGRPAWEQVAPYCGVDAQGKVDELCRSAEGDGQWEFLAAHCPALSAQLAQRECAGRSYTTFPVAEKYRTFCSLYGSAQAEQNGGPGGAMPAQETRQPQESQPKSVTDKAKESVKKLRGLLGR